MVDKSCVTGSTPSLSYGEHERSLTSDHDEQSLRAGYGSVEELTFKEDRMGIMKG